jgi:hypothetical protein
MGDNDEDRAMKAWLKNKDFEHLDKYVQAGRKFRDLETEEIKQQWIAAFKTWSADFRNDPPVRLDLEAELRIRGDPLRSVLRSAAHR